MKTPNHGRLFFLAIIPGIFLFWYGCSKSNDNNTTKKGAVADIDGNYYDTVRIGTQTWMVQNLMTTKLNDGTSIPLVTDSTGWSGLSTPGYCWYNNDISSKAQYGALYNWYAVKTGKLCPAGWHVPSFYEWSILITYLGGGSVAGGKLKTTGTIEDGTGLWYAPNEQATNESGFSAKPGGYRYYSGNFMYSIGHLCYQWASNEYDSTYAWGLNLYSANASAGLTYGDKRYGFSVRCIKD